MNKRDTIKIYAKDGKEFAGTNYEKLVKERDGYEAKLEKEELEKQERLRKLEEERKKKEEAKDRGMKWITDCVDLVNHAIEKYKDETGETPNIEFVNENGKLVVRKIGLTGEYIGHPIIRSKWLDDFFEKIYFRI